MAPRLLNSPNSKRIPHADEGYQDGNAYLCADQVVGGFPEHGDNDFEESKAPTDKDSTDEEYEDGINQDDDGTSIDNDDTL